MGMFKLGKMTFGSLFKKPETTLYPFEKKEAPAQLKGQIDIRVEDCILCGICAKTCPCGVISVDKATRTWTIDRYGCIQCGSCKRQCPKKCLDMLPDYAPVTSQMTSSTYEIPEKEK